MATNPKVPELLQEVVKNLRDVTSLLVLNGQSNEANQALSLLQGVELLANQSSIAAGVTEIEMSYARGGDKIAAVKAYRNRTKSGLKEAIDAIENAMALPAAPNSNTF